MAPRASVLRFMRDHGVRQRTQRAEHLRRIAQGDWHLWNRLQRAKRRLRPGIAAHERDAHRREQVIRGQRSG